MAKFYGSLRNDKTEKTLQGHRLVESHVRGWDHGVRCTAAVLGDAEVIEIEVTGGSNSPSGRKTVGRLVDGDWKPETTE